MLSNDEGLNNIGKTDTINQSEKINISGTEVTVTNYMCNNVFETNKFSYE